VNIWKKLIGKMVNYMESKNILIFQSNTVHFILDTNDHIYKSAVNFAKQTNQYNQTIKSTGGKPLTYSDVLDTPEQIKERRTEVIMAHFKRCRRAVFFGRLWLGLWMFYLLGSTSIKVLLYSYGFYIRQDFVAPFIILWFTFLMIDSAVTTKCAREQVVLLGLCSFSPRDNPKKII